MQESGHNAIADLPQESLNYTLIALLYGFDTCFCNQQPATRNTQIGQRVRLSLPHHYAVYRLRPVESRHHHLETCTTTCLTTRKLSNINSAPEWGCSKNATGCPCPLPRPSPRPSRRRYLQATRRYQTTPNFGTLSADGPRLGAQLLSSRLAGAPRFTRVRYWLSPGGVPPAPRHYRPQGPGTVISRVIRLVVTSWLMSNLYFPWNRLYSCQAVGVDEKYHQHHVPHGQWQEIPMRLLTKRPVRPMMSPALTPWRSSMQSGLRAGQSSEADALPRTG